MIFDEICVVSLALLRSEQAMEKKKRDPALSRQLSVLRTLMICCFVPSKLAQKKTKDLPRSSQYGEAAETRSVGLNFVRGAGNDKSSSQKVSTRSHFFDPQSSDKSCS